MRHKTFQLIESKADESGSFSALASVFNNVDSVGDRVLPGAFDKTLAQWREIGDPIPVILSHNWKDPYAMIGKADPNDVVETERGLLVHGQLDIDHNETARQVHHLMKDRLLKGWSFGYTVPEGGQKRVKDANNISEIDLIEVGPTLVGANREAELQGVKSSLDEPSPVVAAAQLRALAIEADSEEFAAKCVSLAESLETSTNATTQDNSPPSEDHEDRPDEEPETAKSPRQVSSNTARQIRRMLHEAELGL